jgi:hypothetical protein
MLRFSRALFSGLPLCLPLCVLAAACDVKVGEKGVSVNVASEQASDTWKRSYALPAGGRLEFSAADGAVQVVGTPEPRAEVTIVRDASAMTREHAQEALASADIFEDAGPEAVRIEIRRNEKHAGRLRVRATVAVPRGLTASVRTQNGRIELENVDGQITVAVANGPIDGHNVSGRLSASVVNGRLSIDLGPTLERIELKSVNGAIRVGIPAEASADLQLDALNGAVSVDPRLNMVSTTPADGSGGEFSSNRVVGRLNAGGPKILAHATNGAVRFGLPGDDLERRGRRGRDER